MSVLERGDPCPVYAGTRLCPRRGCATGCQGPIDPKADPLEDGYVSDLWETRSDASEVLHPETD